MQYCEFNILGSNGKSNCVVRSFSKLFNENYDKVFNDLCSLAKELNCDSFNDIDVFETYMKRHNIDKIECSKDTMVKDLVLDNGKYIVFCYDKKDFYHMVTIIDNVLYDKDNSSLDLYVISLYKENTLVK